MDSLVAQDAERFRAALLARDQATLAALAARWVELEKALEAQIAALAMEIEQMRLAGKPVTIGTVRRMERYQSLLMQARAEVAKYQAFAADLISQEQGIFAGFGWEDAGKLISAANVERGILAGVFDKLPTRAVETLAGYTADGSTLLQYFEKKGMVDGAMQGMVRALQQGITMGWNPTKTAQAMQTNMTGGLQQALRTARTETMRAYREATRLRYEEEGITTYKRMASKSTQTCIACLLADGTVYKTDITFEEHPEGRCTLVPVIGDFEPTWETGKEWFLRQDERTQREILGPAKYTAWKSNKVELDAFLDRVDDKIWGASIRERSLKSIMGDKAQRWYVLPHIKDPEQKFEIMRSHLVGEWVEGSKRPTSILFKLAVQEEFGMPGKINNPEETVITPNILAAYRDVVRRMYNDTQKDLKERGIQNVHLYRGIKESILVEGVFDGWTTDEATARKFGTYDVLEQIIDARRILAWYDGPGWRNGSSGQQWEYLVLYEVPK